MSPLLIIPLSALVASVLLHALSLTIFPRLGLLDSPARYGLKRPPVPYPVGIVALLIFVIFFAVLEPLTLGNWTLLLGIAVLGITCFVDDRIRLHPGLRLGMQIVVTLMLIGGGIRIDSVTNPLPGILTTDSSITLDSGWLLGISVAFTVVWLLFTINALNWFDGIPGQVSTLSVIGFLTIGFLSLSERVNQPGLALIAFILAGISLGVLFFDFSPPKLLIGDTGAMFFGLMIGVLTIYSGGKVATAFLVLGVPLIDLLFVLIRRMKRKQPLWKGDAENQHLHHRLLNRGWSPRGVIALTATIGGAFGITALFLSTFGKVIAGMLLLLLMLALSWYSGKPKQS